MKGGFPRLKFRSCSSAALIFGLAFAACSMPSHEEVFSNEQDLVRERTGYQIEYSPDEKAVGDRIREFFADGLSPDEAVKIALLNNQGLQASYEKLGIARGELIDAGLLRNPVFQAEIHFEGGGIGRATNLNVIEEFISVLQLPLRRKVAQSRLEAAKFEVARDVLELIYQTKAAFYSVQGMEQTLALRKAAVDTLAASAELRKRQKDAGNVTPRELLATNIMYAKAHRELAESQASLFDEREKLNRLLGLWGECTDWTLAGDLPDITGEAPQIGALEALAVSRRPELLQARAEIEALATEYGLTDSYRLIPQFELGVDLEGEDHGRVVPGPNLSVPIPIFNQGQGLVVEARARLRRAQLSYASQAVNIRSEVRSALNRFLLAREQVAFDEKQILPLTRESVKNTQLEFNAMLAGSFELLQSRADELDAQRAHVQSLRDYWVARSDLEKAIGGDLPQQG